MYESQTILINPQDPQDMPFEMDLCSLLETMRLSGSKEVGSDTLVHKLGIVDDDLTMMLEDPSYHSDDGSEISSAPSTSSSASSVSPYPTATPTANSTNTNTNLTPTTYYGCAYLQTIQSQLEHAYSTTGGEYVDAIFTHREIFCAHPPAHRECARAFSDIAFCLERREWRADREADMEAVAAFRHEAWMIANMMPPLPPVEVKQEGAVVADARGPASHSRSSGVSFVCVMPAMYY